MSVMNLRVTSSQRDVVLTIGQVHDKNKMNNIGGIVRLVR